MKIGVNLVFFRPEQVGGGGVYCRQLLAALNRLVDDPVVIFCGRAAAGAFEGRGFEIVEVSSREFSQLGRLYDENWGIAQTDEIDRIDVLFSPANIGAPLLPHPVPQVLTVHDLQHEWYPENFSAMRLWGRRLFMTTSLWRAERVIAVSEFTARDVRRRYGDLAPPVTPIHEGVDRGEIPSPEESARIAREIGLPDEFFFYPASYLPHKNHDTLLEAFRVHRHAEGTPDTKLLLSGRGVDRHTEICSRESERQQSIRHLGYLERREVLAVLARATALVFPSRFEGFGLPLVEAMACETPIIASNRASIPEVVGEAGMLLEPDEHREWARAMTRVVGDEPFREELIRRGRRRGRQFSWTKAAEQTLGVLREAAAP